MFQHNDLHRYTDPEKHQFSNKQVRELIFQADLHLAQRGMSGIILIPILFFIAAYTTNFSDDYPNLFLTSSLFLMVFTSGRLHSVRKINKPDISSRVFWQRYYFLASLGTGICWGCLGAVVLYLYGANWSNLIVLYMIAGIGGGAVSSYSNWLHLNIWYLFVLFGPVTIASLFFCEKNIMLVGWLSIFSFLYNFAQAKLWNSIYWNSLINVFLLDAEVHAHEKAQVSLREEISERRKTQKNLILAKEAAENANNAKTEFLSNMSHEMRTPLHAMLGFSRIGRRRFGTVPRERLREYFSLIHESGERLLRLLNDLLELSRQEVNHNQFDLQHHDLNIIVELVITETEFKLANKDISVIFEAKGSKVAFFDRQKIIQVLHNLLDNAVKYSDAHTEIEITIEEKIIKKGKAVQQLTVKDQGVGLPENEYQTIFEKFTQSSRTKSNAGGTGLGLAISKGIIEAHSGTITAKNNPEGGTSFTITLPVD